MHGPRQTHSNQATINVLCESGFCYKKLPEVWNKRLSVCYQSSALVSSLDHKWFLYGISMIEGALSKILLTQKLLLIVSVKMQMAMRHGQLYRILVSLLRAEKQ